MIRSEEARLTSLFRRLLLLSAAAAPAACSTSESASPVDASTQTASDATLPSGDAAQTGQDGGPGLGAQEGGASDAGADGSIADGAPGVDANDIYGFVDAACDPEYVPGSLVDGGDDGSCTFYEQLPCGLPPGTQTEVCALLVSQCGVLCSHVPTQNRLCGIYECLVVDALTVPDAAPLLLECATGAPTCAPGVGRRPAGLVPSRPAARRDGDGVGTALAEMAYLEAASVHAFRRLRGELVARRAPRALVRQAERAARDEVRHAKVATRLAKRRGAKPARVAIVENAESAQGQGRSLADFAVENAVEGCVRECFGALVATRQASCARDPELAREMRRVARDETRHAALAWAIARWVQPRLDRAGRARVATAMAEAVATLRAEVERTPAGVGEELGLPTGDEAVRLVDTFAAAAVPPF